MENKESKFLKISCPRCRKTQIVFGKSATRVKCSKCNKLLIKNTGGKAKIKARVQEIL
ncbi:30S ribosomal protein S27e [Candidatus Pacearchaeota archaeon]|nr:30S ribosomal protein S27e [Candidatus Pacearchaeota archaeon]